jgi:hypothetical protein
MAEVSILDVVIFVQLQYLLLSDIDFMADWGLYRSAKAVLSDSLALTAEFRKECDRNPAKDTSDPRSAIYKIWGSVPYCYIYRLLVNIEEAPCLCSHRS